MEKTKEMKLAESLTAETTEIIPYLPYLLQDLWELGSSPKDMIRLLKAHGDVKPEMKFLDLCCGKGAVSVRLAQAFGVHVTGVDIMEDFIRYAEEKAREYQVEKLCEFYVGDVCEALRQCRDLDCVIWGAAGNLLDGYGQLVEALAAVVKPGGYILLDDCYVEEEGNELRRVYDYLTKAQWNELFERNGLEILAAEAGGSDIGGNDRELKFIEKRAEELIAEYPGQADMFRGYVESQRAEYEDLQTEDAVGAFWFLQKRLG